MNKPRRKEIEKIEAQIASLKSTATQIKAEIESVRADEDEAFENLSETMQQGDKGEAMQTASSNLEESEQQLDDIESSCDEAIRNLEAARE